jgi:hypothetical protein
MTKIVRDRLADYAEQLPGKEVRAMHDKTSPRPTTVRLQRMVRAYRESAALMAGVELGLFTRIAQGHDTQAALADVLGLTALHAERIIVACVGLGLLERDADKLANAPDFDTRCRSLLRSRRFR